MKLAPFTWRVGVDNCFGYLIAADGSSRDLVETHLFHADYGLVVRLSDTPSELMAGWLARRRQPQPRLGALASAFLSRLNSIQDSPLLQQ